MKASALAQAPVFADLSDDELSVLAAHAVQRKLKKNAIVVNKGDESETLYIVVEGRLRMYLDDESGNEITVRLLGPGDVFGELALFTGAPRTSNVMTMEPCTLLALTRSQLTDCLTIDSELAFRIIRALAQRIQEMMEDMSTLGLLDVYGRLRRTLEKLAKENDGKHINYRLTHQDLANMVGSSREMVSRILRDLTAGGYITVHDKQITINKDLPTGW